MKKSYVTCVSKFQLLEHCTQRDVYDLHSISLIGKNFFVMVFNKMSKLIVSFLKYIGICLAVMSAF